MLLLFNQNITLKEYGSWVGKATLKKLENTLSSNVVILIYIETMAI